MPPDNGAPLPALRTHEPHPADFRHDALLETLDEMSLFNEASMFDWVERALTEERESWLCLREDLTPAGTAIALA